jgi:hypothetical protein
MKFFSLFLFLWVSFVLLGPDPDPAIQINADPCGSVSEALPATQRGERIKMREWLR